MSFPVRPSAHSGRALIRRALGLVLASLLGVLPATATFAQDAAGASLCSSAAAPKPIDKQARPSTALPAKPAPGLPWTEPLSGSCLVRATDHANQPPEGFARNDYSRRQAMNADNSLLLVSSMNGYWHVYDTAIYTHVGQLPGLAGDAEPQWSATEPNILYYLPNKGLGMKVLELDVRTGLSRTIGDLGARLKAKWPGASAAWTKSEGSPSADGRYWCFMVDDAGWGSVGVVTWDRVTDTLLGSLGTHGDRPDHVSMSPSGNHCVVSGDSARGTVAFSRDFSSQRKLLHKSEHSDLALDANGDDVYVAVDYQSSGGDLFMVNLRTGVRTVLFPTYVNGTATALHVSGKAFRKPGWIVVSTYADTGRAGPQWLHRQILAVQLAVNPRIYHLADHRSTADGYWTTPVASVNRDFTRVVFNSTWGVPSKTDVDTYVIHLPPDAFGSRAASR